jgi:hypothetical protein
MILFPINLIRVLYLLTLLIFTITSLIFISFSSYAKAKVYCKSKTLSQEFQEYEKCRLIKTLANVKDDGNKDGYNLYIKDNQKVKTLLFFKTQ